MPIKQTAWTKDTISNTAWTKPTRAIVKLWDDSTVLWDDPLVFWDGYTSSVRNTDTVKSAWTNE